MIQTFYNNDIAKQLKLTPTNTLNKGKELLKLPCGSISAIMHDKINENFIREKINESNMILIGYDYCNGSLRSVRGFQLIKVDKHKITLLAFGRAKRSTMKLRRDIKFIRGMDLMRELIKIKTLYKLIIEVFAIDEAIPYYYNQGWRFKLKERCHYKNCVKELENYFNKFNYYDDDINKEKLLQPFFKFTKFTKELLCQNYYHDNTIEKLIWSRKQAKDDGFKMILY